MAGPWLCQTPRAVNSATVLSPLRVLHRQSLVGELLVAHSLLRSLWSFFEGPRVSCV